MKKRYKIAFVFFDLGLLCLVLHYLNINLIFEAAPPLGTVSSTEVWIGEDGIKSMELPRGRLIYDFSKDMLIPHMVKEMKETKRLPKKIAPDLFDRLTEEAKKRVLRYMKLPMDASRELVVEGINEISSATIKTDSRFATVMLDEKRYHRINRDVIRKNSIVLHGLFALKKGLFLRSKSFPQSLYFLNFNRGNLREFTANHKGLLNDRSYTSLCDELKKYNFKKIMKSYLRVLWNGFNPASFRGLEPEETSLVFDSVGITLAEHYFMHFHSQSEKYGNRKTSYIWPYPQIFLAFYLYQGGRFVIPSSESTYYHSKPSSYPLLELKQVSCSKIFDEGFNFGIYDHQKSFRVFHRVLITRAIQNHYPFYYWLWKKQTGKDRIDDLFDEVIEEMKRSPITSYRARWLIMKFVDILGDDASTLANHFEPYLETNLPKYYSHDN